MTDSNALLLAVLENPVDDTLRLVLADLFRESENEDVQARGRFLWAGVTASRFSNEKGIQDQTYFSAIKEISDVAAQGFPASWLANLGLGPKPLKIGDWEWNIDFNRVRVQLGHTAGYFARGMLTRIVINLADWCKVASSTLVNWPLEMAIIRDVPSLKFRIDPPKQESAYWLLSASMEDRCLQKLRRLGEPFRPFLWSAKIAFSSRVEMAAEVTHSCLSLLDEILRDAGRHYPGT